MLVRIIQILRLLIIPASQHRRLVFENLALRQQFYSWIPQQRHRRSER